MVNSLKTRLLLCSLLLLTLWSGGGATTVTESDSGPAGTTKNLETYWAETDLNEYDFVKFLADDNCLKAERQFMACVNAISSVAEKLKLKMTPSGEFAPLSAADIDDRLTEKSELAFWKSVYREQGGNAPYSFLVLWLRLKDRMDRPERLNGLLATGINAYLSVAKDPHTYIVPLAYYEEVLSQSETRSAHLGFVARRVRGGALVRKVFTDSPAARSGLRKGDRILELNGEDVAKLHVADFNELIRGQGGAGRLRLKVRRQVGSASVIKHLEILRGETQFVAVESRLLEQDARVGLLTIHKFARETCQGVRKHLVGLIEQGIEGLVLDLRDNPGGQVDEAACVAGLFLEPGSLVFQTKYLDPTKKGEVYWAEGPQLYDGPVATLINSGSASAAEIVAGALKDLGRTTLIGERSFGKGSFQDGILWRQHTKIALFQTQGFYYFASGWTPQIVGLQPDVPAGLTERDAADALREEDLYLVPLRPMDLWTGPQGLAWLSGTKCLSPGLNGLDEDAQIQKATDWVRCHSGEANGISGL